MFSQSTILIVDDETNIRNFLKEILEAEGYQATTAASGEVALTHMAARQFDLALIDLKLPGMSGVEVLKVIRQESPGTTIIILTAHASLETAVEALRQGAHDYLFKPCKPDELRSSVRRGLFNRQSQVHQQDLINQLRKMSGDLEAIQAQIVENQALLAVPLAASPAKNSQRFLDHAGLTIDLLQHLVTLNGHPLDTTPTEFDLLVYLIREAPRAISPKELTQNIQGYDAEAWEASNIVRRHIHRLRQKIREITKDRDIIQTIRGIGYAIGKNTGV